jgi:hypothetical protein
MRVAIESAKFLLVALFARIAIDELPLGIAFEADYEEASARIEEFVDAIGIEAATGYFECEGDPALSMLIKQMSIENAYFAIRAFFEGEHADMLGYSCELSPLELIEVERALAESAERSGVWLVGQGSSSDAAWKLYRGGMLGIVVDRPRALDARMEYSVLFYRLGASERNIAAWNESFLRALVPEEAMEAMEAMLP